MWHPIIDYMNMRGEFAPKEEKDEEKDEIVICLDENKK